MEKALYSGAAFTLRAEGEINFYCHVIPLFTVAARLACENAPLTSDTAVLLITPLLIVERRLVM